MKQLFFNHLLLLKYIKRIQLTIFVLGIFGSKIFAQQIFNNGGNIVMNGAAFMIVNNASFINNGTFIPSTSTVSFTGSGAASLAYSIGTNAVTSLPTIFHNLTIANTSNTITGTVNPLVSVENTLSVSLGTLACSTGNLTLLSRATNTANVSAVGGAITGNVNVQRYIPSKRAWRLLTAPVAGSSTIWSNWQNSGGTATGAGMYVTGASPSGTNGLDVSNKNTASMKTWTFAPSTSSFTNVTDTKSSTSTISNAAIANTVSNIGYFAFVRGDRSLTNMNNVSTSSITTLSSIGALQTGALTYNIPNAASASTLGFALIGNPYAAPVDFASIVAGGGLTNISTTFYTWDASMGNLGAYVTFVFSNGSYSKTTNSSSTQTTAIQSGQAFFVTTIAANTAASITFKEAYKTTNNIVAPIAGFRPMGPSTSLNITGSLAANIYYVNGDSSLTIADGNLTQFSAGFNKEVLKNEDAFKLINISENLGLVRNGTILAIESRPNLSTVDTIFLNLTKTSQRAYRFNFEPAYLNNTNLVGYLQDKYLNKSTEISLVNNTPVNFNIDGNAGSYAVDRFQIVFKSLLPFAFTNITATKNNSDIAVNWKVANETDIVQYDVEKSTDGITFTKVKTTLVTGNNNAANNYIWLDGNAQAGDNIYRVKMLGKDGSTKYTENVNVTIVAINTGISIYPNPIKEGKINIQMGNQPSGTYLLSIINNNGQVIYTGTIQNNSNKSNFLINLNTKAAKGIYNLQITTPQNKISTQKLIVE